MHNSFCNSCTANAKYNVCFWIAHVICLKYCIKVLLIIYQKVNLKIPANIYTDFNVKQATKLLFCTSADKKNVAKCDMYISNLIRLNKFR